MILLVKIHKHKTKESRLQPQLRQVKSLNKFVLRILNEVKGLFLLLLCLLSSAIFTLIRKPSNYKYPDDDPHTHPYFCDDSFFGQWCLSKVELTHDTYVYFIQEEGILFLMGMYILFNVKKFFTAHLIFVLLQVVDVLDLLTSYQKTWFYISTAPISWNILKVAFFTLAIINEIIILVERRLNENRYG